MTDWHMTNGPITDEMLTALADDELAPAEAASLRARIADDPELAERYALFVETRALLEPADARDEIEDEAGLARLAAAIHAADAALAAPKPTQAPRAFSVIEGGAQDAPKPAPAARETARPKPRFWSAMPAMAASLALVVGGIGGYVAGRGGESGGGLALTAMPAPETAVAAALESAASGEKRGWSGAGKSGAISVVSTHRLKDGRLCREFEASVNGEDGAATGLGCRQGDGTWRVEIAARGQGQGAGYGTASGASIVENALEGLGSPGAVPEAEERSLLASGWKAGGR